MPTPRGVWLWLVSWREADSFGVHLEDIHGQLYRSGDERIFADFGVATSTTAVLGSQYNGFIKQTKYYMSSDGNFTTEIFKVAPYLEVDLLFFFDFV